MTRNLDRVGLHRMVDRPDPDQVRALRAVAQQLLRYGVGRPVITVAERLGATQVATA